MLHALVLSAEIIYKYLNTNARRLIQLSLQENATFSPNTNVNILNNICVFDGACVDLVSSFRSIISINSIPFIQFTFRRS